jgi:hypothetical protein
MREKQERNKRDKQECQPPSTFDDDPLRHGLDFVYECRVLHLLEEVDVVAFCLQATRVLRPGGHEFIMFSVSASHTLSCVTSARRVFWHACSAKRGGSPTRPPTRTAAATTPGTAAAAEGAGAADDGGSHTHMGGSHTHRRRVVPRDPRAHPRLLCRESAALSSRRAQLHAAGVVLCTCTLSTTHTHYLRRTHTI